MDTAFGRASKAGREERSKHMGAQLRTKKAEIVRVESAAFEVRKVFQRAVDRMPQMEELSPFYVELVRLIIDLDRFRKSLGSLGWVIKKTREFELEALVQIRRSKDTAGFIRARKAFYGRISSLLRNVRDELSFLKEVNKKLRDLPTLEEEFTVVIAGAPNVGKSTLLWALTGSKPRIESYPFTTQQLLLGYFEKRYRRYQIVDIPGLLDRPQEERNPVEKQGTLAIKLLSNLVLFVFDPTETCGFPLDYQLRLYEDIAAELDAEVIPVVNKEDLWDKSLKEYQKMLGMDFMACSSKEGTGVSEIVERIVRARPEEVQS